MTAAFTAALPLAAGAHPLVHANAALNALATTLLLVGLARVKRGRETAHGRTMIAALVVSALFLTSYLAKYAVAADVRFTATGPVRYVYLAILGSHVLLAVTVPFLAVTAMVLGSRALGWGRAASLAPDERLAYRRRHRRLVRWAFPVWLYVSITGVVVYFMLYHIWPSAELAARL